MFLARLACTIRRHLSTNLVFNAVQAKVFVEKDIQIGGSGLGDSSSISIINQMFSQVQIPEPSSITLPLDGPRQLVVLVPTKALRAHFAPHTAITLPMPLATVASNSCSLGVLPMAKPSILIVNPANGRKEAVVSTLPRNNSNSQGSYYRVQRVAENN